MLAEPRYDATTAELLKQPHHRLTNHADAGIASLAAPGDEQNLRRARHLLLAQPGLGPLRCRIDARKTHPQVQCPPRTETGFIERAMYVRRVMGSWRASHPGVYARGGLGATAASR